MGFCIKLFIWLKKKAIKSAQLSCPERYPVNMIDSIYAKKYNPSLYTSLMPYTVYILQTLTLFEIIFPHSIQL